MDQFYALTLAFLQMTFVMVGTGVLHSQRKVIGDAAFYLAFGMLFLFAQFICGLDLRVSMGADLSFQLGTVVLFLPYLAAMLIVYIVDGTLAAQRLIIGSLVLFGLYYYLAEITRIEQEYLSLFYGLSETSEQTMHFDVVPEKAREAQMYVAFRLSDTDGLLPSTDIAGRPIVLEFIVESRMADAETASADEASAKKKGVPAEVLHYRVPATTLVRLLDAENLLLQSRIPVYQLGTDCTCPLPLKKK